ncbi:MAG TPA: chemotaxis protein CheW [Holophagaceae bacterium]
MPEGGILLLARAAGRDLLLSASDLVEVLPSASITPLPGPLPGVAGVILHQGEFLPVLDWSALPGAAGAPLPPVAMAILKRRLALPLEFLSGALETGRENLKVEPSGEDPWAPFMACACVVEGPPLPLLDSDKLIDWLHQRRPGR